MWCCHRHGRLVAFWNCREAAKETVGLVLHARRKVDLVRIAAGIAGAGNKRPEIPYRDRSTVGVFQLAEEMIVLRIEDIDGPIAEISDKEIVGELSKARGRDRKSPGRIERAAGCHPVQQMSVQVELVHETITGSGDVIVFCVVLQCEGDEQVAIKN